ncbi:hypothetical protein LTR85_011000 [Meristemomyces frigidus]|nr:hypothetical protein LTR85_011000 [Meristemomyces frigidus]
MADTESHGEKATLKAVRPDIEESLHLGNEDGHEDESAGLDEDDEDDMSEDFETTSEDTATEPTDPGHSLVNSSFYPSLPLDHTRREIRLMRVLPGDIDQPIQCILCIVSLNDHPAYEALSYTWGSASRGCTVKVNREYVEVTDNLAEALTGLRQMHKSRTLWIDALCIDQSDVVEINGQVAMMDQIYRTATRVLVWLGGASVPDSDPDSPYLTEIMLTIDDSRLWRLEDHKLRSFVDATESTWPRWWERIWVVQEVTLASWKPVAHFGLHSVSWDGLSNMLAMVRRVSPEPADPVLAEFSDSLSELADIKRLFQAKALSLETLIFRTARRHATDPRDRLYSLKNLLDAPAAAGIGVDYSKETWEVFARTTYHVILEAQGLTILHLVQPYRWKLKDMASWAIDFSPDSRRGFLVDHSVLLLRTNIFLQNSRSLRHRSFVGRTMPTHWKASTSLGR